VLAKVENDAFTLSAKGSDGEWDDIETLSIGTQANSNTAITTLDVALTSVNKARAELGSVINRLTYAADNLSNVSQNTSASRSRVMDTDYAKATTELAKSQIIQQAATAMLAQANQQPSAVLSLLQ
jgi:flagellin